MPRAVIDHSVNKYGEMLVDFMLSSNTCMLNGRVGEQTFTSISTKGKAVVDYCIVPHEQLDLYESFHVKPVTQIANEFSLPIPPLAKMSDHSVLVCTLDYQNMVASHDDKSNTKYINKSKRYNVNNIPDDFMVDITETIKKIENTLAVDKDIEMACNELVDLIRKEMDTHLHELKPQPASKNSKLKQKPWWNDTLKDLWHTVCQAEKQFLAANSNSQHKQHSKHVFVQARKAFDRAARRAKRNHQRKHVEELKDLADNDSVGFWKKVKKMNQRSQQIPLQVEINGEVVSDISSVMNKWHDDFKTLFCNPNPNQFDADNLNFVLNRVSEIDALRAALSYDDANETNNSLNNPLTYEEVKTSVMKLKSNKATGPDCIPAECLKNRETINILYKIYTYCFESGAVPESWLASVINPIFKAGSRYNPLNYRGIALINIICKCYSSILNRRICVWMDENDIINDEQNGFRQARSCLDHMYVLYTIVKNRILLNRSTFCCFIDAKKAFDCVHHDSLWYKLHNIGIRGKMLYAVRSLYDKAGLRSCIRLNEFVTDSFNISAGVRQGDPLSPTLFSIYVNDLITELNRTGRGVRCGNMNISALFYADDIVVMSETSQGLQAQLDTVHSWFYKWRMQLNQDKTQIIHFRKKSNNISNCQFKCGNVNIKITSKYKYLGLVFNEFMDTDQMVDDVIKSSTRALGHVISKYKNCGGLIYETFNALYQSCVQPVMMYGAALWGSKEFQKLNTVQNKACKFFLGISRSSPNIACHGDMGWLSVFAKQKIEMVRLWCRLQTMDNSRLTHKVFRWSNSLSLGYIHTWEYQIKELLKQADMYDGPHPDPSINPKAMMHRYREAIVQIDKDNWHRKVWDDTGNEQNGNKLRLYRCVKKDIFVETYITTIMPLHHRQNLAMLRFGCLPIEIELGRRNNTPLEMRLCKQCNMNCIEDERHLLLECPLYDDLRSPLEQFIPDINASIHDQYCSLLSNPDIQALLAKCIFSIMKRRSIHNL